MLIWVRMGQDCADLDTSSLPYLRRGGGQVWMEINIQPDIQSALPATAVEFQKISR